MTVRIRKSREGLSIDLGSSFVTDEAEDLCRLLAGLEPASPVVVDFREVRDCHDVALSLLARAIVSGPARVALRGTSQHQERILRYLGIAPDRSARMDGP